MIRTLRRFIKPLALWLNATLYKASEEKIDFLRDTQIRLGQLAYENRQDASHYARFALQLSAKEYRQRVRQRKLAAKRVQINQW